MRLTYRRRVYFIQRADTAAIKIGCSACPEERRRQLQSDHKAPMEILAEARSGGVGFGQEMAVHRVFEAARIDGEWFQPVAELLDLIASVKATGELPPDIANAPDNRASAFARRYCGGETLQSIADDYGITRERVRQILRQNGVPSLGWRPHHRRNGALRRWAA